MTDDRPDTPDDRDDPRIGTRETVHFDESFAGDPPLAPFGWTSVRTIVTESRFHHWNENGRRGDSVTFVHADTVRGSTVLWRREGSAAGDPGPFRSLYYRLAIDRSVAGLVGVSTSKGSIRVPTRRPDELQNAIEAMLGG